MDNWKHISEALRELLEQLTKAENETIQPERKADQGRIRLDV
jgi:hypothetical protein